MLAPDVPVIPVVQWGVQNSIDLYRKRVRLLPRPRNTISIGEPLDLSEFHDAPDNLRTLRRVADVMVRRLRQDLAVLRNEPAPTGELYVWTRNREVGQG
jgi:1-acyl-sn-glycerol-3-phosphate acyltransferase